MSNAPLMPKATAVWLVENTSLTFDQIADFCKLHPLEVKGIADGEVAVSGMDAIGPAGRLLQVVDRNRDDAVRHFLPRLSSARYNQKLQACATMGR